MNRRRILLSVAGIALGLTSLPAFADASGEKFITNLGAQAIKILSDKSMSPAARKAQFRTLFLSNFDVPAIGRFVLGRYGRQATPAQRQEFNKLYTEDILKTYSRRLSQYTDQTMKVTGSRADSEGQVVQSQIQSPNNGRTTHIDWVVTGGAGHHKIVDVVIENLSMRSAQRDDYSSVIGQSGLDGLIAALRKKVGTS